jgi:YidC/Oxa1 family membrane protein insertase
LKRAKKEIQDPKETIFAADSSPDERQLKYIGVDAQYFAVAYVPPPESPDFSSFRRASAGLAADASLIPRHQERAVNVTYFLDSEIANVPAGGSMREELRLFAGPKQPDLLAEHGLDDLIYYGWFAWFARILAGLLHVLYGVGNYAIAIILLTVIVRAGMFPLSRKAAINAQKMQELAPEIKKINEQYKDDMEGKLKAQRELQQRVGFNPLAGCLPMFLQLPIFIGLYRALSVDIDLRQAAVSSATNWASNLAGPDMLLEWGSWLWEYLSGRGTGWLGPYFNILPVIVVVLFLVQQKMFMPPATDEQTAMTQKMMNIMTLMMGLFFFRVPAGLCIYFITSSLWGICERVMVKKTLPTTPHFSTAVLQGTGAPVEKPLSIVDRIRNQVTKPEAPIERPNKRRRPPKKKT